MTELPDTAAIRARWLFNTSNCAELQEVLALCDALDAARAERDAHFPGAPILSAEYMAMQARVIELKAQVQELAEKAWMYDELCK